MGLRREICTSIMYLLLASIPTICVSMDVYHYDIMEIYIINNIINYYIIILYICIIIYYYTGNFQFQFIFEYTTIGVVIHIIL